MSWPQSLLHKTKVCIHLAACSGAFLFAVYLCFHARRGRVEQSGASGNSIFPASPLCLSSWAQSGLDEGFFQSFVQILVNSTPVCKSMAQQSSLHFTVVLTCFVGNINDPFCKTEPF